MKCSEIKVIKKDMLRSKAILAVGDVHRFSPLVVCNFAMRPRLLATTKNKKSQNKNKE